MRFRRRHTDRTPDTAGQSGASPQAAPADGTAPALGAEARRLTEEAAHAIGTGARKLSDAAVHTIAPEAKRLTEEAAHAIGTGARKLSDTAVHTIAPEAKRLTGEAAHAIGEGAKRLSSAAAEAIGPEAKRLTEAGMKLGRQAQKKGRRWIDAIFGGDKVLWTVIVILLIFSMLLTFSATVYKPGGTPTAKLFNQLFFIFLGIGSLLVVHLIRYQIYGRLANFVFFTGLVLTVLAMLIGPEGAGARRDLVIPVINQPIQPFEILKIGVLMVLAKQLARRQKTIEHTPILPSLNPLRWMQDAQGNMDILRYETIPLLGPIAITCVLTFLSVGNSTTLIIATTCMVMLFIGRVRMADLGKIVALVAVAGIVFFAVGLGRSDTGRSRMASFKPDMLTKHVAYTRDSIEIYSYPPATRPDGKVIPGETDQSINAKMSIASGGFFGKGPGMSTHRSNLAEAERDFAYAFIIEEYGAVGGLIILLLYLWLFFRTIQIFKKCGTAFPSLLVLGLGLMIVLQAMIHMLVSVSLFPITGQQLPLISKGGSSLVFTLMALGMILGVSRQTAERTLDTPKNESLFEHNND